MSLLGPSLVGYSAVVRILVGVKLFTSGNVEPAHNTTKNFAPTHDEVVNLTGLL
jgi:ABC-type protease/lipase transport system fused ATPase/permease subunit